MDGPPSRHGYRIARLARDAHELLDRLAIDHADVLGWSMGVSVWWSFIEQYGTDRIRRFIAVDQSAAVAAVPWMSEQAQADRGAGVPLLWDHCVQDWRDVLLRIDVPTLVIGCDGSHIAPSSQRYIADQIPDAQLHIFPVDVASSHFRSSRTRPLSTRWSGNFSTGAEQGTSSRPGRHPGRRLSRRLRSHSWPGSGSDRGPGSRRPRLPG